MTHKREIKFDVCIRKKDGTDLYNEILTIDDLLNRNGSLYHPDIYEVVYKRQYTEHKDKNGKEIYHRDNVKFYFKGEYVTCEVVWNIKGLWSLKWSNGYINNHPLNPEKYEVVGNALDPIQ